MARPRKDEPPRPPRDPDFVGGRNPIKNNPLLTLAQSVAAEPPNPLMDSIKFDTVVALIQEGNGVIEACKISGLDKNKFYAICDADKALQRKVDRAREIFLETKLLERDQINRECEAALKSCDPKRANALQNHYKERIRQIEWEIGKRMPKKYGDSMKLSGEIGVTSRVIRLPAKLDVGAPV